MTDGELITRLGGVEEVARLLDLDVRTVHNWNRPHRGIPGPYWPFVCSLCMAKGIGLEELASVRRNPSPRWPDGHPDRTEPTDSTLKADSLT